MSSDCPFTGWSGENLLLLQVCDMLLDVQSDEVGFPDVGESGEFFQQLLTLPTAYCVFSTRVFSIFRQAFILHKSSLRSSSRCNCSHPLLPAERCLSLAIYLTLFVIKLTLRSGKGCFGTSC